jgi:hypothetical protein
MIFLLAMFDQDPIADFDKYKAAYDPYRRCVTSAAKAAYPKGENFKSIYQAAQRACMDKRMEYSMDATLIDLERASTSDPNAQPAHASYLGTVFDEELVLELTQDFVPRKR